MTSRRLLQFIGCCFVQFSSDAFSILPTFDYNNNVIKLSKVTQYNQNYDSNIRRISNYESFSYTRSAISKNQSLKNHNIDDVGARPKDNSVIERLDLSSKFNRWKTMQNILEEEEIPSAQDINEILYTILKSFLDFPRSKKLPNGDTNPSPILNEEQRNLLVNKLFRESEDGAKGWIDAIPTDDDGQDSMQYDSKEIIEINYLLEKFQPDPQEEEDAFKSCWDLVMEMYGKEATRMAVQSGDNSWKVRSGIVRLLIHFDFLIDEELTY
jgi:hypothetical protein